MSIYYQLVETFRPNVKKLTKKETKLLLGRIEKAGRDKVSKVRAY